MKRTACVVLIMAGLLLATTSPSVALGPDDGVWQVTQFHPAVGLLIFFASIHQNDAFLPQGFNFLFASLFGDGAWRYGIGIRSGQVIHGTLYFPNGGVYGTFSVTLSGATLSGQASIQGTVFAISGNKLF